MATSSNEYILAKYIFETINNGQNIDFVCSRQKELLLQRMVHRFVKFHSQSKHGKCIRQCICINHCRYEQFQVQSRTNESSETIIIQSEGELNETINGQKILLKLYLSSPNPKDGHECLRIDQFGMALLSVIKEYPNSLLDIDIHGNRLMGTECIELISQICSRQVQAIDFRGCLFSFNKVQ